MKKSVMFLLLSLVCLSVSVRREKIRNGVIGGGALTGMRKIIILKILFLISLVFFITGCDDEISVPEGTLKVVLKNAPDYNSYKLKILIYSLEDKTNAIEERMVPNNQEIEIHLNLGNYLVKLSSSPAYNNLYLYEKAFQIRQNDITEVIFEINK